MKEGVSEWTGCSSLSLSGCVWGIYYTYIHLSIEWINYYTYY